MSSAPCVLHVLTALRLACPHRLASCMPLDVRRGRFPHRPALTALRLACTRPRAALSSDAPTDRRLRRLTPTAPPRACASVWRLQLRSERSEIGMSAGVSRSASPSTHEADQPPSEAMEIATSRERDPSEVRSAFEVRTLPATSGSGEEEGGGDARSHARSEAAGERSSEAAGERSSEASLGSPTHASPAAAASEMTVDATSQPLHAARASRSRQGASEQRGEEEMARPGKRRATSGASSGAFSSSPRASKRHQVGRS